MSLHLDARQRAMLQEMGVTIWAPAQVSAAPAPVNDAARSQRTAAEPPTPAPAVAAAGGDTAATPRAVREQRAAAPGGAPAPRPPAPQDGSPTPALVLHAAQALYPTADPAQTPAGLGAGWLVVAESLSPTEPLAGDAGRLLDNMLRAMQLHRHPRVFLAALGRSAPGTEASADIPASLADAVAQLQPAMVLVLGHVAARAALGRTEPLGRLRAGPHVLAGCPAVVTYDPAVLLRSQDNKAAAWADLCRALAMVRSAEAEG